MKKFNRSERTMLLYAYTPKLILDGLGFILFQYFLGEHKLLLALAALLLFLIAGMVVSWKKDIHKLAETPAGKVLLTQAKPLNVICCTIGFIVFSYGSWIDSYLVMIGGAIIAFVSSQLHIKKAKQKEKQVNK